MGVEEKTMVSMKLETRQFRLSLEGGNGEEVLAMMRDLRKEGFLPGDRGGGSSQATNPTPQTASEPPTGTTELVDDQKPLFGSEATQDQPLASTPDVCEAAVTRRPDGIAVKARLGNGNESQAIGASSLILMGAEASRGQTAVTAASLTKWIRLTGYQVVRIDREIQPFMDAGFVLAQGRKRGKRYLLTEAGKQEARRLARDLLERLGQAPA